MSGFGLWVPNPLELKVIIFIRPKADGIPPQIFSGGDRDQLLRHLVHDFFRYRSTAVYVIFSAHIFFCLYIDQVMLKARKAGSLAEYVSMLGTIVGEYDSLEDAIADYT